MSVAVLGGGAFGTALAISLAAKGPVTLWARDAHAVAAMRETRENPRLPGCPLPETLHVTGDLDAALRTDTLLLSVPMQSLGAFLAGIDAPLTNKALVACCKGIDLGTLTGPSAVIAQAKPDALPAVLTGPSFAADLGRGRPTALTLGCADEARGQALQETLSTPTLRLYRSTDTAGAELGGALKNVIALACGAAIGLDLGDSARAALMTRGFAELTRLAVHLGADAHTMTGLSGMGDLALTCHSPLSRNFSHGEALGRGATPDPRATVEGVATAQAVAKLAARDGLDLPICTAVAALTTGASRPADILSALLTRPLKEE